MGFKNPLSVSNGKKRDGMKMRIKNSNMFVSEKNGLPLNIGVPLKQNIPP